MKRLTIVLGVVFVASLVLLSAADVPTYVGAGKCRDCHKTEKQGKAFPIWEASKHAQSANALKLEDAKAAAEKAGLTCPPEQSPVCQKCHVPLAGTGPEVAAEGVTCEVCHGPGSLYRKLNVMVNREASVKAGLIVFASPDAIKTKCLTCHENAHGIKWDFDKAWEAVKHNRPEK